MRPLAILLFVLALKVAAQSVVVAPAPVDLYTLRDLAWDSPGCTNWQVFVRTQTNALPIHSFEIQRRQTPVSNLQYDVTYWLSVRAQSNNVWSAESDLYKWPHDRTNYVTTVNQTAASILGTWADVPTSLRTTTNPPYSGSLWRIKIWESNNVAPYVHSQ